MEQEKIMYTTQLNRQDFDKFLRLQGLSEQTIKIYRGDFEHFFHLYIIFDQDAVDNYVLKYTGNEPATVKRKLSFLKKLAEFSTLNYGSQISFENIKPPKTKSREFRVPTDSDIKEILLKTKSEDKISLAIRIMICTGCRIGSLVGLNIEDLKDNILSFQNNVKRGGSYQSVIDDKTLSLLKSYLDDKTSGPLFTNKNGGRITTDALRRSIKRRLGENYVNPHAFRHWISTTLLNKGMDLFSLQKFLNHSSINSTQRYIHISTDGLQKSVKSLHPLFS